MSTKECIRVEELESLASRPAGDPRRAHADACPRCGALLASYREFMSATPVAGARPDEAAAALAEALRHEVAVRRGGAGRPGGLAALFVPAPRPALALAALAVVAAGAWLALRPAHEPLMRGPVRLAGVRTLSPVRAPGELTLAWKPVPEAARYEVRFYGTDLGDLASVNAGSQVRLTLRRGALPKGLVAGSRVLWQVVARRGADSVATSKTQAVELP